MAFDPVTAAFEVGGKLIDRLWPNPAERDAAKLKLVELQQSGDLAKLTSETELAKGQLGINLEEAKSTKMFIAGWRPALGWVGVISLALVYWPKAIVLSLMWTIQAYHAIQGGLIVPPYPDLGLTDILGLLASVLGIGGMRSLEKIKGAEGNR